MTGKNNGDNDGDDFVVFVSPTNPASNTALGTADFDQCGSVDSPTEISSRVDITGVSTGGYNDWTLTSTSAVNTSGISKFCAREGHDVLDSAYAGANGTYNDILISYAEAAGTTQDPKLVVEHSPTSNLSVEKTGDTLVGSGLTAVYTVTATNNGPTTAPGVFVSDAIPSGFTFRSAESSPDCTVVGSTVRCGTFTLANGTSTGRTIAFTAAAGACNVARTNTATVSGAVIDLVPADNSGSVVTTIVCPAAAMSVRKPADETVTNNSLQSDDHLSLTLAAGKSYIVKGALFATSTSATPDIRIAFTGGTINTMDIGFLSGNGTQFDRAQLLEAVGVASNSIPIAANDVTVIQVTGTVKMKAQTGALTLRWAQNTTNAAATRLKEGSFLSVEEIR